MIIRKILARFASVAPSNRISAWTLFVAVALAPLPFGSTEPAAIAVWCIVLGIGTAAASLRPLQTGQVALLGLAAAIIAAYAIVLHEQLSPNPWFARPHWIWGEASAALGVSLQPSASIARDLPFFAIGAPLAAMLSGISSFVVCADRKRAYQLLRVTACSGLAYAVFGLVSFGSVPGKILWRDKIAHVDDLTSTFTNRNTASVYFGSVAIVWLVLLLEKVGQIPSGTRFAWLAAFLKGTSNWPRKRLVVPLVMLLICVFAMFLTRSRAGILLCLASLVLAFVLSFRRALPRGRNLLTFIAGGGVLALILLQTFGSGVGSRFGTQGLSDEGRFETYRSTWQMVKHSPWFGTGLGSFQWAFPAYRGADYSIWGVWDRAHNTPLEVAAELGIPLATVVVASWVFVIAFLASGVRRRRRDIAVPIAALSVALLAVSHSLIDFSLQIPGFSIVVFALVGAGLAQSFNSTASSRMRRRATRAS
jgi:hypothetical protein